MSASAVPASEIENQVCTPDGDYGQQSTEEPQQEQDENPLFASPNGRETFAESKEGAVHLLKSYRIRKSPQWFDQYEMTKWTHRCHYQTRFGENVICL